jgi:hypothetical protein
VPSKHKKPDGDTIVPFAPNGKVEAADLVTITSVTSHIMGLNNIGFGLGDKLIAVVVDKKSDGNFSKIGSPDYESPMIALRF